MYLHRQPDTIFNTIGFAPQLAQPRSDSAVGATIANLLLHRARMQIVELEEKLQQMSKLAHEDALTGILNRRGLDAALARELPRAARQNSPLCLGMIDLDDFKQINDRFGHHAGDSALIHVARIISSALRKTDILARTGGEEFVIALPDTALPNAVDALARIQRMLAGAILHLDQRDLSLTFSAGVAALKNGEDAASLMRRADIGIYEAKRRGKNCVVADTE